MEPITLSPLEEEIVKLAVKGLTNEAIAQKLDLSVGAVSTYWLRVSLRVGGPKRTDAVERIIKEKSELALRAANVEEKMLAEIVAKKERDLVDTRASLALLHLALEEIQSTVWATDRDLILQVITNADMASTQTGIQWEVGKSIYDVFASKDSAFPPIAAHLQALQGTENTVRLDSKPSDLSLRVMPLRDEANEVLGCVSILNVVGSQMTKG